MIMCLSLASLYLMLEKTLFGVSFQAKPATCQKNPALLVMVNMYHFRLTYYLLSYSPGTHHIPSLFLSAGMFILAMSAKLFF